MMGKRQRSPPSIETQSEAAADKAEFIDSYEEEKNDIHKNSENVSSNLSIIHRSSTSMNRSVTRTDNIDRSLFRSAEMSISRYASSAHHTSAETRKHVNRPSRRENSESSSNIQQ